MKEIALHLLDIVQNSITAGAANVVIDFVLSRDGILSMSVIDDGRGMDADLLKRVQDPFTTTRTTRKVGLGIPLLTQNAILSGGDVKIDSIPGEGTTITAQFDTKSIDCLPLGDLASTIASLVMGNPDKPDFTLRCSAENGSEAMHFSTQEIRGVLEGVSLSEPEIIQWIQQSIREEIEPILGGIMR